MALRQVFIRAAASRSFSVQRLFARFQAPSAKSANSCSMSERDMAALLITLDSANLGHCPCSDALLLHIASIAASLYPRCLCIRLWISYLRMAAVGAVKGLQATERKLIALCKGRFFVFHSAGWQTGWIRVNADPPADSLAGWSRTVDNRRGAGGMNGAYHPGLLCPGIHRR